MLWLGRSQGQNPRGHRPRRFWPRDPPRHNIHHDTSKVFSYNVIIIASRTNKEGFLSGWVWSMEGVHWILYQEVTANIGRVKSQYTSPESYNNVIYTVSGDRATSITKKSWTFLPGPSTSSLQTCYISTIGWLKG